MKCRGGLSRQVSFVLSLLAAAIGYQTKAAADTLTLTWVDSSTNESGFQIERKTGSAGTYAQIATVVAPIVTEYGHSTRQGSRGTLMKPVGLDLW
jgi:hypothetical protein